MLAPRRGPLRPVVIVLIVLSALVLGTVLLGSNHTSPTEARTEALAYLDKVRPLIERSTSTGRDIGTLRQKAIDLDRDALDRQLGRAEADASGALVEARAIEAPKAATLAQDLLVGVLGGRATAVKALHDAVSEALGTGPTLPAVQALTEVGRDLQAADGAYRLFTRNLPPGSATPPESRWITEPDDWSAPVLGAFVTALRNSGTLAPIHDVGLLVVAPVPGPVGKDQGLEILAATQSVALQIVLANQGNQEERQVSIIATTQPFDGATPSQSRTAVDLAAGQKKALELPGLAPPAVGVAFAIIVRVGPVAGDANPVDDELTRRFVLR